MTVSFDTNILIYAYDLRDLKRQPPAMKLVRDVMISGNGILPAQVMGEFLSVAHRKRFATLEIVREAIDLLYRNAIIVEADRAARTKASALSEHHGLQFFDALICAVSTRAGARILLSEDMQDGRVIDGLTILNPFNPVNAKVINAAIGV